MTYRRLAQTLLAALALAIVPEADGRAPFHCPSGSAAVGTLTLVEDRHATPLREGQVYRLVEIYRRVGDDVTAWPAHEGALLCEGDRLETWHGATATIDRFGGVGESRVYAAGGTVLTLGEEICQLRGTATYYFEDGDYQDAITCVPLGDGRTAQLSGHQSTYRVDVGPGCGEEVVVAVSRFGDARQDGSGPEPERHGVFVRILDERGQPLLDSEPLWLPGGRAARLSSGDPLPELLDEDTEVSQEACFAADLEHGEATRPLVEDMPPVAHRVEVLGRQRPDALYVDGEFRRVRWRPDVSDDGTPMQRAWPEVKLSRGVHLVELRVGEQVTRQLVEAPTEEGRVVLLELERLEGAQPERVTTEEGGAAVEEPSRMLDPRSAEASRQAQPPTPPMLSWSPSDLEPITAPPTGGLTGEEHVALEESDHPMRFIGLSGGQFTMGSPEDEEGRGGHEGPQHRVFVPAFYAGQTEVTQGQWAALAAWASAQEIAFPENQSHNADDWLLPVDNVTWCDALRFAEVLSKHEGRKPYYEVHGPCEVNGNVEFISTEGYRIPTEAEWEFLARAGTTTRYWSGDTEEDLAAIAWYKSNSDLSTHQVASPPSVRGYLHPWGLFDIHGNVTEWTLNWWSEYEPQVHGFTFKPVSLMFENEAGQPYSIRRSLNIVKRGGSHDDPADRCRSAFRYYEGTDDAYPSIGFRLVLEYSSSE